MTRPAAPVMMLSKKNIVGASRVGSEGVGNLTGRVGLGREVFDISPVGSGRPGPARPASNDPTREYP